MTTPELRPLEPVRVNRDTVTGEASHEVTAQNVQDRPREGDMCIYCRQALGADHLPDCVMRSRVVIVEATIRMALPVPEDWDEEAIRFRYNEGTWCADNLLDWLGDAVDGDDPDDGAPSCLCHAVRIDYVGEMR